MFFFFFLDTGQTWQVHVPAMVNATLHSNVTISCKFSYPPQERNVSVKVYWKIDGKTKLNIKDKDKNEFIFHPNHTFVNEMYRGNTFIVGDISKGECSLMITNIRHNVGPIYLRINTEVDDYSFKKENQTVFIRVSGKVLSTDHFI